MEAYKSHDSTDLSGKIEEIPEFQNIYYNQKIEEYVLEDLL